MLAIHLPLRINTASKGVCDIYLVITMDALTTRNTTLGSSYDVFVPPLNPQLRKAGVEEGKEFIRCHFSLKAPGNVFMPKADFQKPLSQHARGLLLSLKSLSQAMSFEVYLARTPRSEDVVSNFFQRLRSDAARSPSVKWKSTFSGRKVVKDEWVGYHIYEEDTLPVNWNPLVEECPPSYNEAVQLTRRNCEETSLATEILQHPDFGNLPKPANPSSIPGTETPSCSEDGEEDESRPAVQLKEKLRRTVHFEDERPRDEVTEKRQQKNRQAPEATQEDGHPRCGPQQSRHPKRKADEAVSDTEPDDGICLRESLFGMRHDTEEYDNVVAAAGELDVKVYQLNPVSAISRFMSDFIVAPSSVFDPKGRNRRLFSESQFTRFCDVVLWLRTTWTWQPLAHDTYFIELSTICYAILKNNKDRYLHIRWKCMDMFLKDPEGKQADNKRSERRTNKKGPWEVKPTDRAHWISRLIYHRLGPGSDTLIFDELLALQHLSSIWKEIGGDHGVPKAGHEKDYALREVSFNTQMAACVLVAFYKEGMHPPQEHGTPFKPQSEEQRRKKVARKMPLYVEEVPGP
ncbi:hypothetical protein SLS56_011210 [Neofusicoccum ribis]|uniref:Uncharacterized protein n=1 Tax=Neofusicoccum ribis TaxID=45134 RepID=A0ABR3SCN4_9PEZI